MSLSLNFQDVTTNDSYVFERWLRMYAVFANPNVYRKHRLVIRIRLLLSSACARPAPFSQDLISQMASFVKISIYLTFYTTIVTLSSAKSIAPLLGAVT